MRMEHRLSTTASEGQPRAPRAAHRYDAFISYSHAIDGALAPALQRGLQRFAKPWYRPRALRIFRDEASLSANPALWSSITEALDNSSFFILLASPGAASSPWTTREAEYWRSTKPSGHLLLALTDGELVWDASTNDFDWERTTGLPKSLEGAFTEEPRYIDLRWAHDADHLSLSDARFRDAVAELAAPLHGVQKDVIAGEEVRQHRRTVRIARAAGAALAGLTVAAFLFGAFALIQRNEARRQRDLALSRSLVQTASAKLDDQLDLAALLSVEAYRARPGPETRSALVAAVIRSDRVAGVLDADQPAESVATAPDGSRVAVTGRESVSIWTLDDGSAERRLIPVAHGKSAAFSADGNRIAVSDPDSLSIWDVASTPRLIRRFPFAGVLALAYVDRRTLAAVGPGRVVELDEDTGRRRTILRHADGIATAAFSADGSHVAVAGLRTLEVAATRGDETAVRLPVPEAPGSLALDSAGRRVVVLSPRGDRVTVWALPSRSRRTWSLATSATSLGLSPDGLTIALGGENGLVDLRRLKDAVATEQLSGPAGDVRDIDFYGDSHLVTTSEQGRTLLWDTQRSIIEKAQAKVAPIADLDVAQSANAVVIGPSLGDLATLWAPGDPTPQTMLRTGPLSKIAVDAAGREVVAAGRGVHLYSEAGDRRTLRPPDTEAPIAALAMSSEGVVAWGEPDRVVLRPAGNSDAERSVVVRGVPGSLDFSGDGALLAVAADDGSSVWDMRDDSLLYRPLEDTAATEVAISRSGRLVATGLNGRVVVWDSRTKTATFSVEIERNAELSVSFSPDGETLAIGTSSLEVGSLAGELLFVDSESGLQLAPALSVPGGPVADLDFGPDGEYLAVGTKGGIVTLYDNILWADVHAMEDRLCAVAGRNLTEREWRDFVGGPYRETC